MGGLLNYFKPASNLSILTGTARAAPWPSLWQLLATYRTFSEGKKQRKNISFSPIRFSIFFFGRCCLPFFRRN
jgi:hypothetical protein